MKYLNVDIAEIKRIAMRAILDGEPVWFGCDTGKMMDRDAGLWDKELFDYRGVYNTEFSLTKAERLVYGESAMTHAMVFTGADVVDGKPRRWRVENSWGDESGWSLGKCSGEKSKGPGSKRPPTDADPR